MSDVARTPSVVAALSRRSRGRCCSSASEQLRNMASMGGNLRQRTRCAYLRDGVSPCNKREPGSGCAALDGFNRGHAILGTSEHCIATHPSDVAVALVAFDAVVQTARPGRRARDRRSTTSSCCPATRPSVEHPLAHGELIVGDRGARRADRPTVGLPQVPRPAVLRVRAGVGRGGDRGATTASSPTCGSRSAASAPSRGGRAGRRPRSSAARPTRRRSGAPPPPSSSGAVVRRAQRVQGRARPAGDRARPQPQR